MGFVPSRSHTHKSVLAVAIVTVITWCAQMQTLHPFIGAKSMLVSEGELWAQQRAAFNPAFAFSFLKRLVPTFVEKTLPLVSGSQQARTHMGCMIHLGILAHGKYLPCSMTGLLQVIK